MEVTYNNRILTLINGNSCWGAYENSVRMDSWRGKQIWYFLHMWPREGDLWSDCGQEKQFKNKYQFRTLTQSLINHVEHVLPLSFKYNRIIRKLVYFKLKHYSWIFWSGMFVAPFHTLFIFTAVFKRMRFKKRMSVSCELMCSCIRVSNVYKLKKEKVPVAAIKMALKHFRHRIKGKNQGMPVPERQHT